MILKIYKLTDIKTLVYALGLTVFFVTFGCDLSIDQEESNSVNETTWWIHGDTHVGHETYKNQLSNAVTDVNSLGISNFAVTLGDCIDGSCTLA